MCEVRFGSPIDQVWRTEDSDCKINGVSHCHNPSIGRGVPKYLRISELRAVTVDNRILFVFCKSITVVMRVCDVLCFSFWGVQGVNCHHAISLIWKETRSVVNVDYRAATEYPFVGSSRKQRNRLVDPCEDVLACGMAPVLVSSNRCSGIVYVKSLVCA